jgi:formate hydrogenlyase subunit 6/NADH:ubiquinone oxidoreductase subunit I
MGYFKDIYESLSTTAIGMRVTFSHFFEPSNTIQWPHEPATTTPRTRSELFNNIDDCIGCMACSKACPVDCIHIATIKSTKDVDLGKTTNGKKKSLHMGQFDIDMAQCCYCGLCVDACPTDCLVMTEKFDYSVVRVEDLYYRFAKMSDDEIAKAKTDLAEEKKRTAAAKAAKAEAAKVEAAAKAAASADAKADTVADAKVEEKE